jgi:hypothetical protein
MSQEELAAGPGSGSADRLTATESRLGQVLAMIHRILPKLDDPARAAEIQTSLQKAASLIEAARQAYEGQPSPHVAGGPHRVATAVEPQIAAVIAAAVAVLFNRPYRLVSVQQVVTPVPNLNVWALEGRTQIFQSHKIR